MPMYKQVGRGRAKTEAAEYFRFLLRMPQDMARQIDALAKYDFATMNGQILKMLRAQLEAMEAEEEAYAEAEPGPRARSGRAS